MKQLHKYPIYLTEGMKILAVSSMTTFILNAHYFARREIKLGDF